jgi:pectate lyase
MKSTKGCLFLMRTALFPQNNKQNFAMKHINPILSVPFKVTCRKTILAAALFCGFSMMANAQIQDGRDFSMDGFAAYEGVPGSNWYRAGGTTGGAGGKVVKADNFSQLQAYLQATDPYIVIVDHDITTGIKCYVDDLSTGRLLDDQSGKSGVESVYGERIMVAPNKTLIGVVDPATGLAPLFSHITFVMQSVDNIIIRNCRFTMKGVPVLRTGENKIVAWRNGAQVEVGDPDCIGIQADKVSAKTNWGGHIWIDHCEFFNGDAANKDRYDGLLDCKNNVQWMTFSYNYFHDHDKSCLWGKGDSDVYDNCRTISFHHNFFDNIQGSRLPLQRGGHVHYYNNYMRGCEDGWDIRTGAVAYEEGCYFENTKSPIRSDRGGSLNISKAEGYDCIYKGCNNLMEGYTNIDGAKISKSFGVTKTDWVPTQTVASYTQHYLDKTVDVPAICEKYSGAGKVEIWKAYTNEIPTTDVAEFDHAIKNYDTAKTFDANGNTMSGATTGILFAGKTSEAGTSRIEYYDLAGSHLSAPQKGINIVKKINFDGIASVKKVIF